MRTALALAVVVIAGSGCDGLLFYLCPPPDSAQLAALPGKLSEAGLYDDIAADSVADGTLAYRPAFELWSDGADKRRWLQLPAGTTIDTADMDQWQFPVGTRVWKEFARGGVKLETRLLSRVGPGVGDWAALSYVWRDDQSDAVAAPNGFIDAGGTPHNVPAASECAACHGGRQSFVLGVSAIQLSTAASTGEVDIVALGELGLLSDPPASPFAIPGDDVERGALGYLHANCGHCHNQQRPAPDIATCFDPDNDLDFWLQVDRLDAPSTTPTYDTAIGFKIEPGDPGASAVIDRITTRRVFYRMPPLGSERVDTDAVALLERWIAELE